MSHFVFYKKRKALPVVLPIKENISKEQKLNTAAFLTPLIPY